jgi:hypothetical protein
MCDEPYNHILHICIYLCLRLMYIHRSPHFKLVVMKHAHVLILTYVLLFQRFSEDSTFHPSAGLPPSIRHRCTLMTICDLGKEWEDPTKIPVDEIDTHRREQSSRGRYEAAMWRAAGLEEPNAGRMPREPRLGAEGGADADAEMEVDNLAAGGFFGWMGREQLGAGRVMARAFPTPTTPTAAECP